MILQLRKYQMPFLALGCVFLLLLILFAVLLMFPVSAAIPQPALLGQADGYSILEGAPDMKGEIQTVSRAQLLQGYLMLVNPAHPLPGDFSPPNIYQIRTMVGSYLPALEGVTLCREAVYALCSIQLEYPLERGAELIRGTLSRAQQEDWRREAFGRYARVYPLNEALNRAFSAVPGGGESEHQLGYALDIALKGPLSLGKRDPLMRNETGAWLSGHMWRYGWIYRNPPENSSCGCEDIHLRFVGKVHAAAMHALSMNLEDYLSLLRKEGKITICRENKPWAYLYCMPCEGNLSFRVPEKTIWQASADNTGYAVIAIAANGNF